MHSPSVTAAAVSSAAEVREFLLDSAARGTPVRVVGRGHWLDAGRPVRADDTLTVAALTGITEYTPGDLTLTARAATPLDEIARVTAAERQWLALDPFGPPDGSLAATIATGSAGPLAQAFGPPRDNVLGVETVTGTGAIVRAGGRVVKNVAGFDLTRLFTGSWGTLGILTEATVRLRALPDVDETVALVVDETPEILSATLQQLRSSPLAALALELVNATLAVRVGAGDRAAVLVRLGGNADAVRAQRATLGRIGETIVLPAAAWDVLRRCEPERATVVRLSTLPTELGATWTILRQAAARTSGALLHASVDRGIARAVIPYKDDEELEPFLAALGRFTGTRIFERLPARLWATAAPSTANDRLSRAVKRSYDPMNILNPGILGEDT